MYTTWPEYDKEKRHKIQKQVHEVWKGTDAATDIAVAATATPQQQNIVVTQAQPVQQQPQVISTTNNATTTNSCLCTIDR